MALLDVGRAVLGGAQAANTFQATKRQNQIRDLQQQISEQGTGFNPLQSQQIQELTGLDPALAQRTISTFEALSEGRQKAFFEDAKRGLDLLNQGRTDAVMALIDNRRAAINQFGGDTSDVDFVANLLQTGQIDQARQVLQQTVQLGIDSELLTDPLDRQIKQATLASTQARRGKPTFAPSEPEKNRQILNSLNSQLSVAQNSGDQEAINAASQQLDEFKKLTGKFGATPQQKADIEVSKAQKIILSKQAAQASADAFKGLKNIRSTITNIGDAIRALDKGADTGPIVSKLPSFTEASVELDNIRNRMGLDVVGSATFGALSESELAFALNTALPDSLQPKALKAWLQRKKRAQTKLAKGLRDAAIFLGKPGNTIADFVERQETKAISGDLDSGLTPAEAEELNKLEQEFGG